MSTIKEKKLASLNKAKDVLTTRTIKVEETEMVETILGKIEKEEALNASETAFVAKVAKRKYNGTSAGMKANEEAVISEEVVEAEVEEAEVETMEEETVIETVVRGFEEMKDDVKQKIEESKPKAKSMYQSFKETMKKPAEKKDIVIGVIVTVALGAIGL